MKEQEEVLILAIESSCDETAAAVVKNGRTVLSNIINSQIDIHTLYGGVVPEIASRKHIENIDVVALMKQTLLELEDKLEEAKLSVRKNMPEGKVILPLDSQRTFRVFENLVINMTKYAMPNSRVFIDIFENENDVQIVMKNMAAEEITFNVDTIAERFVRGDESRNTEGSGLGLAIAKSFVELQNGKFNISVDGDLFKVTIIFEK